MGAHSTYFHYNLSLSELFYLGKKKAFFFFRGVASSGSLSVNDDGMGLVQVVASFPLSFFLCDFFYKSITTLPCRGEATQLMSSFERIERKKTEKENTKHKSLFYYFLSLLNCNWIERARVVQCGHDPNRWSWFSPVLVRTLKLIIYIVSGTLRNTDRLFTHNFTHTQFYPANRLAIIPIDESRWKLEPHKRRKTIVLTFKETN